MRESVSHYTYDDGRCGSSCSDYNSDDVRVHNDSNDTSYNNSNNDHSNTNNIDSNNEDIYTNNNNNDKDDGNEDKDNIKNNSSDNY